MPDAYLPSHEWARLDGDLVTVGVSDFAAGEVGEVIHVELPKVGEAVKRGLACCEIESVKSVNDVYSPVDGVIAAVNTDLAQHPELVNQAPQGKGWFFQVKVAGGQALDGLLSAEQYQAQLRK